MLFCLRPDHAFTLRDVSPEPTPAISEMDSNRLGRTSLAKIELRMMRLLASVAVSGGGCLRCNLRYSCQFGITGTIELNREGDARVADRRPDIRLFLACCRPTSTTDANSMSDEAEAKEAAAAVARSSSVPGGADDFGTGPPPRPTVLDGLAIAIIALEVPTVPAALAAVSGELLAVELTGEAVLGFRCGFRFKFMGTS